MTALGAVVVVGAGQRHLQIELPQRGSPVEDLLELAVGQVHSEQGVVCVDEGLHIVVVFQQGVLHLLVILGQGLALVEGGALVPEILEAHEEVVQPPMEVGVAEQEGQPPAPGHAVGLKIQLKLLLGVLGTEGGRQRAQLQRLPHRLAGGGGGVLVHDLLHCTRIAAVVSKEEAR